MQRMATPIGSPGGYSAIIDARTEDEFALDHLPGAINWPSLNNEQRIVIGTLYKQVGPFEAKNEVLRWWHPTSPSTLKNMCLIFPKTGNPWSIAGAAASEAVHWP